MAGKPYGLIDISIDEAENGKWCAKKAAHKHGPPGDMEPVDWGDVTEHDDKADALESAENLAEWLVGDGGEAKQVVISIEGDEMLWYYGPSPKET